MTREEYVRKFEAVCANLHGFLHSIDQKYIDNLVENLGRTPQDARSLGAWDWTHGIGLYGLHKIFEFTGDEKYLDMIEEWFADRMEIGLPDKNVNTVCPLLTMAFLHEKRPKEAYRAIMDEWAEWIMHDMKRTEEGGIQHGHAELENDQQLWDDTLIMTVLFLSKYGRMTGRKEYLDEAKYQFLLHAKYLYDSCTGLWYHGWSFLDRGHFAGALWGRGNCWITVSYRISLTLWSLRTPRRDSRWGFCRTRQRHYASIRAPRDSGTRSSTTRARILKHPPRQASATEY